MRPSTRRLAALAAAVLLAPAAARAQSDLWPDLSALPAATGGGEKDAAVIVAAEDYAFVEPVPGAKRNADDWQAYLTGARGVPVDHVALLKDDDATVEEMREAAAKAAAQAGAGGTLWFVFIGHGAPSKDGRDGLLVGVDAQQKAQSVYARSLSRNELLGLLAKGRQAKTVVLLDACFSGKAPSGRALVAGLQPLVTMRALPPGVDARTVLMTAARSDQFAGPLPGGTRPAFSYLALGALRGWAADASGAVTASGLVDYVRRTLSLAHDRVQTPELSTPASAAVVLGTGREAGPDLSKLQREAADSSGGGFQVTSLPAVPSARAPKALAAEGAGGLDFRSLDIAALEKKSEAVKLDKSAAAPEEKAAAWRRLAQDVPKFADMANRRASDWDRFAAERKAVEEAEQKRLDARDGDWDKLSQILGLDDEVVPAASKRRWSAEFLGAYAKSPGLEPDMAKALAPYAPAGPRRKALLALALKAPKDRERGKAGIRWIKIPGGAFTMGNAQDSNAQPLHAVTVKPFEMAKTLVTNRQYKECVDAGACTPPNDCGAAFQGPDQPVVCVDLDQARAFSAWAGGRLPSEAEWEYAARGGGKDRKFPWGDEDPTCDRAVYYHCTQDVTLPVCSKPLGNTEQGLCDMAGEAWEWTADSFHDNYDGAPADGSAWDSGDTGRVLRGGSWWVFADHLRAAYRVKDQSSLRIDKAGFRPVR